MYEKVVCKVCLQCGYRCFKVDLQRCPKCKGPLFPVISLDEEPDREFKRPVEVENEEEF